MQDSGLFSFLLLMNRCFLSEFAGPITLFFFFFNTQITLQEGGQTANEELQVTKFGVGFKALSALQQENDLSREEFKF